MLAAGQKLPDFTLPNQDGKTRSLRDFAGEWLALYVYPKDDTPGCTMQGRAFTASKAEFEQAGLRVVGVSADGVESHRKFCDKFKLDVELLADETTGLIQELGVGQSEWKGTKYWERTTFLVDPLGVIRKVYARVVPDRHDRVLLTDHRELKTARAVPAARASQPQV
jgi:peroxiredoxin Q/BCP